MVYYIYTIKQKIVKILNLHIQIFCRFIMGKSIYQPPFLFSNGHVQTIYPTLFRNIEIGPYTRERIDTPDGDFLDLDWSRCGGRVLAIISHGLEGNSQRDYVKGMVRAVNLKGWDALAWNYRTCGGEPNRLLRMYHNGATDDLDTVVRHAISLKKYSSIALIGFSMGGNLTLLYLGEKGKKPAPEIVCAVAFSVPCDLEDSAMEMTKFKNTVYMKRFLRLLHEKIRAKAAIMPGLINDRDYHLIKNFKHFDDRYTAPIHGFKNAEDYWARCSCRGLLHKIAVPSLIVNAANDPILGGKCYPHAEAAENRNILLEVPKSGGHVGFIEFNREKLYWSERRAVDFIQNMLKMDSRELN